MGAMQASGGGGPAMHALAIPTGAHVLVVRAAGFAERRVQIAAERGPDYRLAVELSRTGFWTHRRKLVLASAGLGLVSLGVGAWAGRDRGQLETAPSQLGYGLGGISLITAITLVLQGEPGPQAARVTLAPRLDRITGLALAMRF